ncbi:MAG: alpha/beta hydrolase [Gammaproteobacteria bacterium]
MPRRSKTSWFFACLFGFIAVTAMVLMLRTGPVTNPVVGHGGAPPVTAAAMPGVTCVERVIPARLHAGGWFEYDVAGTLCWSGEIRGKTLLVTVSGAGYDSVYWDFPYEPDTYSFVRAALRRGYAVFNFDRLGMGRSERPFGLSLRVDNQAHVLAQIIETLRAEHDFYAVATVGHSFGSTISLAHALTYPNNVDGVAFTGFVHNANPGFGLAMRDGIDFAAFKGPFAGRILDPTYVISKPGSRGDIFYTGENTDPAVIEVDELNRETTNIGEVITMPVYFKEQSKALAVPAFTLIGEDDFVVCGGAVECTDHDAIAAWEREFFQPAACHEMVVVPDTNHNANLHRNAPANFKWILDWVERRVGNAGPPTQPCI